MIRALIVLLALALPAGAQDLPDWQHTSINDFARVLTQEDTQVLDQALIALHDSTGVQGTVVTLTDRAGYGGADGLEPFATRLFNHWGVGDAERNDGFMVLMLTGDREVRIELGAGYPASANRIAGRIIDDTILPDFRTGAMSRGLREGTLDVIQMIARPHAAGETPPEPRRGIGDFLIPAGVFAFFGFVIVQIGRGLIGNIMQARQPCPNCGGTGLIAESESRSDSLPGGAPTRRQVIWRRCARCGWTSPRETRSAPVSSPSRRRGGGGFGGGRSSGGGASGRW
ncbi:MAG: TPM domain-containing protein [Paracoccus sp. (in: a-proteobacteria)]|nr:TPM domain-containing protein [Paracoccus sp. (in: a-proteobacteria)]